ncbi:hypothetical protein MHM98_02905 [Psychrobium sp. MM17-31]|uniref:hypothetical protein n=1 Tax=Psychrobium sp. MM17-31 TaxID=2917758 RepID=UPI001EF6D46D|nr:hypothetical protein [Psychrobium sp. MM17-31]MCG7530307.1 hypothetical protein [Psychrobium sp. MM17-31]
MKLIYVFVLISSLFIQSSFAFTSSPNHIIASKVQSPAIPQKIVLGQIKTSEIQQHVFNFLSPIYRELGIELSVTSLPSKRSLTFSNQGQLDGELLRVEGIEENYDNLIPIPITLYQMSAYAYTIEGKTDFKHPADILRFTVGMHRGVQWEEKFVSQFPRYVSRVGGTEKKFKLLTLGRVDYVISTEERANEIIAKHFKDTKIKRVSPMLKHINLIHYLHKKHAHLIPQITAAIEKRSMALPLTHQHH